MTHQRRMIWIAGALFSLVSLFVVLLVWGNADVKLAVSDLGLAFGALAAAVACAFRATKESGRDRVGWILLAAALLSWTAGEGIWSYYELALGVEVPFPSLADLGYLGAIPLSAAALLSFSTAPLKISTRIRALLDGLIVTGALLSAGWVAIAGPLYRSSSGSFLEKAIGLAYPLGDIVLISLVVLVGARASRSARVPLGLIGGGVLALAISDIGFAYLTLIGAYASGSPIDAGWLVGYLLIAMGALQKADHAPERIKEERATRAQAFLPYVGIGLILVASAIARMQGMLDHLLFWNLLLVVGLVSVRQLLLSLDNVALTENLEEKVKGRTVELGGALDRLKESQRLQEEFISNTSHELRTPLTTIIGTTHTLLKPELGLNEDGLEMAGMSLRAARRMARIVEDLLVASGISDKMPKDRSSIDVAKIVRETVEEFQSQRTVIEVDVPISTVALGDKERLKVIMGQLLANAEKFAPEGSVVKVKTTLSDDGVEVLVSDQGPGIPSVQWDRIFERFVQLDGGSRRRHGGVGLGLFIAQKLAESMGGSLKVMESSRAGTTFRIRLDIAGGPTGRILADGG